MFGVWQNKYLINKIPQIPNQSLTRWQCEAWHVAFLFYKSKLVSKITLTSAFLWQKSKQAQQEQVTHVRSEVGCALVLPLSRLVQAGLPAQREEKKGGDRVNGHVLRKHPKWFCYSTKRCWAPQFSQFHFYYFMYVHVKTASDLFTTDSYLWIIINIDH